MNTSILTLSCVDQIGVVAGVTTVLAAHECNIVESSQFRDPQSQNFFMRILIQSEAAVTTVELHQALAEVAKRYELDWHLHDCARRPRVMILCSRFDHCLVDLLYRLRIGALDMDVTSILSNHEAISTLAEQSGHKFHYLPVTKQTKLEQETELYRLIQAEDVDLVVLARYMQVLSDGLTAKLGGRCINIHHSFLPSFKGAAPYTQAHKRGVKLIGATAHYVTSDLDEGPIIEQETERVDHTMNVEQLTAIGREIEARVLARAVRFHLERRVLLNGNRTVVFR
ncbi:MAG: formyltetrahydrofolate deformylase [Pseudomonadota bacterium]|jgi:formyltetrahydrofolate deformylase